jgi:hypothetical protein
MLCKQDCVIPKATILKKSRNTKRKVGEIRDTVIWICVMHRQNRIPLRA